MTRKKVRFAVILPLALLALSLVRQKECMEGVAKGLQIGMEKAFPALFPSLVLSKILTASVPQRSEKAAVFLPFLLGLVCGFPMGASCAADMRKRGLLSREDGEKLLFFCNNAGPSFVIGVCGVGVLGSAKAGFLLLSLQSALACAFFLFFFSRKRTSKTETACVEENSPPFYQILSHALREAVASFLYILSCIVFFSFLTELLFTFLPAGKIGQAVLHLFTELTGGASSLGELPTALAFPLCAAGLGWSSLSVHLQTLGILADSDLSYKKFFFGRIVFSLLMGAGASFLQKLL